MHETEPLMIQLTPELKALIEQANRPQPELPVAFAFGPGDVAIRRLTAKESAAPAVQARIDAWGTRMLNRTTALGTVKTVLAKLAELETEANEVATNLLERGPLIPMTGDEEGKLPPEERQARIEHKERLERSVQIESLIGQHRAKLEKLEAEGEPFEIVVPVEMLGDIAPERIAIQNGRGSEYGAIIDSIDRGLARSLRPANEFGDLAHLTTHATVSLRAAGAKPVTERKTLRRS